MHGDRADEHGRRAAAGARRARARKPGAHLLAATLLLTAFSLAPASATEFIVTNNNDSGSGSLRQAILAANSAGGTSTIVFSSGYSAGATILLGSELPIITANVTINGNGLNPVVSGNNSYRPFFIGDAGSTGATYAVTLENLTVSGSKAQGGSGVDGSGGGAGLGGAVFVSSNGALTLSNVSFNSNQASGGSGSAGTTILAGGGGGMGGNGGSGNVSAGNGGGGLLVGSNSNSGFGTNGGGANGGAGSSSENAHGGSGGFGGGGGGAGGSPGSVATAAGGTGGFGGGGGGAFSSSGSAGGAGGYGGGGGAACAYGSNSGSGGQGGFGGGGGTACGTPGTGGFGGGNAVKGADIPSSGGGGGLGAGGAVYVQAGGTVSVSGAITINGNSATAGSGGASAGNGSAFGSGIFFQGASGATNVLGFGAGNQSIADGITDYIGSGGSNPGGGTHAADQGGSVAIVKSDGGALTLSGANTYSGGTTINAGSTLVVGNGQALGSGGLTLNGGATGVTVNFTGSFAIANNIAATGDPAYNVTTGNTVSLTGVLSGSGDVVVNSLSGYAGTFVLSGANTYTGGTTVAAGTLQLSGTGTLGAASGTTTVSGGTLDLGGTTQTQAAVNLAGGTIQNGSLNAPITSTGGTLNGIAGNASLTTTGGATILLGVNGYTGATSVNGGVLDVDGSIKGSSAVTVNAGGVLTGTGVVDAPVTVASGSALAPGNGSPGSSLAIGGNLALQSGAVYLVQVNPAAASFTAVTGTATLGGASVNAMFANGSYVSKTYTILTAAGGVSGSFAPVVVSTNLPTNFSTALGYDANDAYLVLSLNYTPKAPNFGGGLNANQQAVANALVGSFNANGGIPLVYGALTPAGLTQASGELGASSQQTTFNAMSLFMGLLTDPVMQRGGAPVTSGEPDAYAARRSNDAFALITKAPPAPFMPRWSVWAAGFGGSQSTDGNALTGSSNTTSSVYGTAVGADYVVSPNTIAGFALAGGGTAFSVNGLGTGRSDLFQAGAYFRHTSGPTYVTAALAYGWQDITTDRTLAIAGLDHLRAEFNANAWSGRMEGGYRVVAPWSGGIGLTPYAAAQFTTYDLPAYAEQVISGSANFALAYGARSVTDTRTELGLRTDKSFALDNAVLTLRGRLAWAHDFDPDRAVAATFQALPGASFVVNGAAQASDAALTTASAELKWTNGWSAAATFEGEFSSLTRSYAGKGVLRYAW